MFKNAMCLAVTRQDPLPASLMVVCTRLGQDMMLSIVPVGFGLLYGGVEGRGSAELSGYLSGAEDRETRVGVLWGQAAQGKGTFRVVAAVAP